MVIPNSLKVLESRVFAHCSALKTIIIPNSITKIESEAFFECTNLRSVTIPDSVASIGYFAFDGCGNLEEIKYNTSNPLKANNNIFSTETYNTAILKLANGGLEYAHSTEPWSNFKKIIEFDFNTVLPVESDSNDFIEIFDIKGCRVCGDLNTLPTGIYIIGIGV